MTTTQETTTMTSTTFSMTGMMFSATPLGAIRIGHAVTTPSGVHVIKDDQFKITKPIRSGDTGWVPDEIDGLVREKHGVGADGAGVAQRKLRSIPITVSVNDPSLVVRSGLQAFDLNTSRAVCSSNGDGKAKRWDGEHGWTETACTGCNSCSFANSAGVECKFMGRVAVQIEGQSDELGHYVFRTSSVNSIKTFESKLRQFAALFGNRLRGVPFRMELRSAQSAASNWETFHYVDLVLNEVKLADAMRLAKTTAEEDASVGFDVKAYEKVLADGFTNGKGDLGMADEGFDLAEFVPAASYKFSHDVMTQPATAQAPIGDVEVSGLNSGASTTTQTVVSSMDVITVPRIKAVQKGVVTSGAVHVPGFKLPTAKQDIASSGPKSVVVGARPRSNARVDID